MSGFNILSVVIVLVGVGAMLGSAALRLLEPSLLPRIGSFAPAVRVRWLVLLSSVPAVGGITTALVAFGPCVHNMLLAVPDGCLDHGGPDFFFCLRTPMHNVPVAWGLAALVLLRLGWHVVYATLSFARAYRALALLKRVSDWDVLRGLWVSPGTLAMVAGFPRADIFIGKDIRARLSESTLDAVIAHERAHIQRRDVRTKVFARTLAAFVVGNAMRSRWLDELDLAIEESCDAAAAAHMNDPVLVAHSLVELAGVNSCSDAWAIGIGPGKHLEARVRALCEPSWTSSRLAAGAGIFVAATVVVFCITLDPKLHDVTEAAFGCLFGG